MKGIRKGPDKNLARASISETPASEKKATESEVVEKSIAYNSLIPIKPTGNKIPLYIVHGAGLDVLDFNVLSTYMDRQQPVFGIQAYGLNGVDEPLENLPGIANQYIREIIIHNPEGPYLLAGYSFGGHVIVEMRKQLAAMGKPVKMLIMLDTNAEKTEVKNQYLLVHKKIIRNIPKLLSSIKFLFKKSISPYNDLSQPEFKKELKRTSPNTESEEFQQRVKKIMQKNRVALKEYRMEPFDDRIYLIKARISVHYVNDREFLGWKKYAEKGVELHLVPGDHLSMLLSPNVKELASSLQNLINECISVTLNP